MIKTIHFMAFVLALQCVSAQIKPITAVPAEVDFSKKLQTWDGFGFNYVETAQTIDYAKHAVDYGGFSLLSEQQKQEIINLVFGEDGLKVSLIKMFLDPFHQSQANGPFNHELSTRNMREFVKRGLAKTRQRGGDIQIITTLYGPPSYITLQKVLRGRDLDPLQSAALANYMIDWAKFLKEHEKFPVKYISLHNEGEDWERWPWDGVSGNIGHGHDYNMYWPPLQVNQFLVKMPAMLKNAGIADVKVTNGECTNWYRFSTYGYAEALAEDRQALNNLGIITSHGFYNLNTSSRWFGEYKSSGVDLLRSIRPDLHAWVTSTSWSKMDAEFIRELYGNIYTAKVNAIIPWAGMQRPPLWIGGDPNPGCAFVVAEDSTYTITKGYYFYKQVSRAGQPGMAVAKAIVQSGDISVLAFSANGTKNNDAFVVINIADTDFPVALAIKGNKAETFEAFRTDSGTDNYIALGNFAVTNGTVVYTAPKGSVTTFFAK